MKLLPTILAALVMAWSAVCNAQLTFSGPAALSGAVLSDLPLTPAASYTITSPATGINLTGDFYATTSTTSSGNLLEWVVDRPISGGTAPFNITTSYTGFISMTSGGTNLPTGGALVSAIYNSVRWWRARPAWCSSPRAAF